MVEHTALVVTLTATVASLLVIQALHVILEKETRLFFLRGDTNRNFIAVRPFLLYIHALTYGVPGCAIFGLLLIAGIRTGPTLISIWFSSNGGLCVAGVFFVLVGLITALRPDLLIKSIAVAHPDMTIDPNKGNVKAFTVAIGCFLLVFGFLFMALI